ncbi:MAG: glycosyltransferase family 2 protein [Candidatus Poseidoniaceae archaeon]
MLEGQYIGVVIPARNEEQHIQAVLETLPTFVDMAVVVDDGSTDETAQRATSVETPFEKIILRTNGIGVGGAIDRGHQHLLKTLQHPFISIVMAGDGQMDPANMHLLLQPILFEDADFVKGNRMMNDTDIEQMPTTRRRASRILGWLTTLASGKKITDPQCGYTASSSTLLKQWNWKNSWNDYGYPNYWLIHLSSQGWNIRDVPVRAVYGSEISGIKPRRFFFKVGLMMAKEHHKRCFRHLKISPLMWLAFAAYLLGYASIVLGTLNPLSLLALLVFWWVAHRVDRLAMHRYDGGRTKI